MHAYKGRANLCSSSTHRPAAWHRTSCAHQAARRGRSCSTTLSPLPPSPRLPPPPALQGSLLSVMSGLAPAHLRGTAFGIFYTVMALTAVGANTMYGTLWHTFGANAAFATSAGLMSAVLIALPHMLPASSSPPPSQQRAGAAVAAAAAAQQQQHAVAAAPPGGFLNGAGGLLPVVPMPAAA